MERLIRLINDLLDIEKMETGKLDMTFANTDLYSIFDKSIGSIADFAASRQVEVSVEPTKLSVQADADRLVQVMVNLLSNAIKFSPSESTVKITACRDDQWVEISVSDQGRGIPIEHLKTIFERFQQVKSSEAQTESGSGLGLTICKSIIEQHGGAIGVESELGKGSSFWFKVKPGKA